MVKTFLAWGKTIRDRTRLPRANVAWHGSGRNVLQPDTLEKLTTIQKPRNMKRIFTLILILSTLLIQSTREGTKPTIPVIKTMPVPMGQNVNR